MLYILLGIVLLYLGAESLVRGSSKLAEKFGIPPLIVGLTIVAFGTSAPELLVSLAAAFKGASDVAVGNVVGSNIFNIAVILGLTAIIRPPQVDLDLIRREIPILLIVSTVGLGHVAYGEVPRWAGLALFGGLLAYLAYSVSAAKRGSVLSVSDSEEESVLPAMPVWLCAVLIVVGLGVLVAGSHLFVTGAVGIARKLGISDAIIGLTIVSAGTSLPELATSVVAAFKKQSDDAIGNIVGSNLFNILGILGLTALVSPLQVSGIGLRDAGFMLGLAVILLPFAFTQRSISRAEGTTFLGIYGVYLFLLWPQ